MNCWRFGPSIFASCREVAPSARGELELPAAVQLALAAGETFEVIPFDEPVLDLSTRQDIEAVGRALRDVPVRL